MWNLNSGCKIISERDAFKEHALHRKKLENIKSIVDNKPPKTMLHLLNNKKREQQQLKTQSDISHQNYILLKKLNKIERTPSKIFSVPKQVSISKLRSNDQEKISEENEKILNRIESAKPFYSAKQQIQSFLHKKYLSSQLSENARRMPKMTFYNLDVLESLPYTKSNKSVRPVTAGAINSNTRVGKTTNDLIFNL
jgi:Hemingway/CFA97